MSNFNYAIALTGGIASGKSTVVEILQKNNFDVIDADIISREVFAEKKELIARTFGEKILENGEISRAKLAKVIFSNSSARARLESIMHPLIREKILANMEKLEMKKQNYFVDIPLFFESKDAYPISRSLLVYLSEDVQIERLMGRNGYTREESKKRINVQMSLDYKKTLTTDFIDNSGTIVELEEKVNEYIKTLKINVELKKAEKIQEEKIEETPQDKETKESEANTEITPDDKNILESDDIDKESESVENSELEQNDDSK